MKLSEQHSKDTKHKKKQKQHRIFKAKHIMNNIYAKIWQKTQKVNEKFGESSGKFGE